MRQSVRETWMTHPSVGISVTVVFTIAGNQLDTVRSVFNNSETSTYIYIPCLFCHLRDLKCFKIILWLWSVSGWYCFSKFISLLKHHFFVTLISFIIVCVSTNVFPPPSHSHTHTCSLQQLQTEAERYGDVAIFPDSSRLPESEHLLYILGWAQNTLTYHYLLRTKDRYVHACLWVGGCS